MYPSTDYRFIVRNYRVGDIVQVARLWEQTGMGHPSRGDDSNTIERTIKCGGRLILVEEAETGLICGSSWVTTDGRRMFIHHFGILPEFQGIKLSHLLMKASLDFVKDMGMQVKLEVHQSNLRATELYKRYGFRRLGDYDVYIIRDLSEIKTG